jgi:hypothetical protein
MAAHDESRPEISPELEPYVQSWEQDMQSSGIHYRQGFNRIAKIIVAPRNKEYAGMTDVTNRSICVNLRQLDSGNLRTLCTVYHELGHYVFKLDHNSCEMMEERCPSEEYLQENWVELQQEYRIVCKEKEIESRY